MTNMPEVGAFGVNLPYESGWRDQVHAEWQAAAQQQTWSANAAQTQMNFQEQMSNTAHQRNVADLKAAGLNPMMSHMHGGASTPQGAGFAGAKANTPSMPSVGANISMQTAAQVENLNANSEKARAEAAEVREKTPTHPQNIAESKQRVQNLQQEIGESAMRIEKIIAETDHAIASAANVTQQTKNLQAEIPRIQELVAQIKLQNKANLPAIDRKLKELEEIIQKLSLPKHGQESRVHDSWMGRVAAILKALIPAIPLAILPLRGAMRPTVPPRATETQRRTREFRAQPPRR